MHKSAPAGPPPVPEEETPRTVSRRNLLRGSSALALAAGAAPLTQRTAHAQTDTPPPAMRASRNLTVSAAAAGLPTLPHAAVIALNRMGFGPRQEDWKTFRDLGSNDEERLAAYVAQQLDPAAIDDSVCDAKLAAQGFTTLDKTLQKLWADHVQGEGERYQPVNEVEQATFIRAVYSKRQLLEVLVDHWHNHFNTYPWDYWIGPVFAHYDRAVIRKHVLGNFRQMLEAVATSPAMLFFLDNQSNSGDKPNENYARELFELHGMGAENYFGVRSIEDPAIFDENNQRRGYIDADVYGATTCFTGWRVDMDTGIFAFDESRHFPYAKLVLDKVIPDFQGIQDGKDVLDLLAYHPASARYICRRLCRRLISDNPPESVVQAAADVFVANQQANDQLKKVVRTILLSEEFRTTWGEKIKRPFEYSISILRALGADFVPVDQYIWNYDAIGQGLFSWRPPDGYPDDRAAWSSTMSLLQRWRHANWLFGWKDEEEKLRLRPEALTPGSQRVPTALVDFWSRRLLGRELPPEERQSIIDFLAAGRNPDYELPEDQFQDRLRQMVILICLSPSFQWR